MVSGESPPKSFSTQIVATNSEVSSLANAAPSPFRDEPDETPLRFEFVSDTKAPKELSLLEQSSKRRHREHRSRIVTTEERISTFNVQLVKETSAREAHETQLLEHSIVRPLGAFVDRFIDDTYEQGLVQPLHRRLCDLESDVSLLTQQMVDLETKQIVNWNNEYLIPLQLDIEQLDMLVQMEAQKSSKREEALWHRLGTALASNTSVLHAESRSSTVALLQILEEKIQDAELLDEQRIEELLREVQDLKEALHKERQERQQRDEEVLEDILKTQQMLEQFVLDSVSHYDA